jgi:hypothetical protein
MYPEKNFILFTGHMIDKPGRAKPRFPASKEAVARKAIAESLQQLVNGGGNNFSGIAGGACGGDILFHETAAELDITTALYLALPPDEFVERSVAWANKDWVDRFNNLCSRIPVHILPAAPAFQADTPEMSIWERSNNWMLHHGLQNGGDHMSLLALWNGEAGDGKGGTAQLMETARRMGSNVSIIDTRAIFEL